MNAFLLQNRRIYREPLSNNKAVHGKEGEGKAETSQKTKSNPCLKGSETIYEHEKTNIIISRGSFHKGIWMLCNDCLGTLKFGMRLLFCITDTDQGLPQIQRFMYQNPFDDCIFFICNRGDTVSRRSPIKPLYYSVFLTPRQALSSHPRQQMV